MTPPCPICGKEAAPGRTAPFCSVRCAEVDLGRWFSGTYAIPAAPTEDELEAVAGVDNAEHLG